MHLRSQSKVYRDTKVVISDYEEGVHSGSVEEHDPKNIGNVTKSCYKVANGKSSEKIKRTYQYVTLCSTHHGLLKFANYFGGIVLPSTSDEASIIKKRTTNTKHSSSSRSSQVVKIAPSHGIQGVPYPSVSTKKQEPYTTAVVLAHLKVSGSIAASNSDTERTLQNIPFREFDRGEFKRLVESILQDANIGWTREAIDVLQKGTEDYGIKLFEDLLRMAQSAGRVTITVADLEIVRQFRRD